MQSSTTWHVWAVALGGLLLMLVSGCGSGGSTTGITMGNYQAIRALSHAYSQYLGENRGNAPPDEATFRTYLESNIDKWSGQGVTVDKMLVSPRSGQPLVVVTGKKPPRGPGGMTIFAYEGEPTDGKRLVIASRGMFDEMEESEFQRIVGN